MGNAGSHGNHSRSRRSSSHNHHNQQQPPAPPAPSTGAAPQNSTPTERQSQPPQPPESSGNRYVFAAATPYPPQNPNPNTQPYYQYSGYYPPPPSVPLPAPFDHHHHHRSVSSGGGGGRNTCGAPIPAPIVEHQKAVTIRNDVNIKKESLRVEPDELNPGKFIVAFTFDATVAGSITIYFFAKEGFSCNLTATKEKLLEPVTVSFKEGLGQKFKQPLGTGIDFSLFEEVELTKEGEMEIFPLAVKAEASPPDCQSPVNDDQNVSSVNSQITQAVFEKKEKGDYRARVVKQILWVNGTRYELQEIYGIGNSVDSDYDANDPGKECVICLSEPRDTTVLPCRHMCMCSGCAKVLRYQTHRCPICRQPVERLLEIKVNSQPEEQHEVGHG